jgi:uncharacterized protein HemX
MEEQKINTRPESGSSEEDKTTPHEQKSKTASQSEKANQSEKTSQQTNAHQSTHSTTPDWVMHLLTGAGALGGNYLLFIKPLQEKFDAMTKAILLLEKKMAEQEEQIKLLDHEFKSTPPHEEDLGEQNNTQLFTVKNKSNKSGSSIHEHRKILRF